MRLKIIVTRKAIIKEFAFNIANLQKDADKCYYKKPIPNKDDINRSSWLLDQIIPLKVMCTNMGICNEVYKEAYKIYDFRNSGRRGYTLSNGVIVKE